MDPIIQANAKIENRIAEITKEEEYKGVDHQKRPE